MRPGNGPRGYYGGVGGGTFSMLRWDVMGVSIFIAMAERIAQPRNCPASIEIGAVDTKVVGTVATFGFIKRAFGVQNRRPAKLDGNRYRGSDHGSVAANDRGELGRQAAGADNSGRRLCR